MPSVRERFSDGPAAWQASDGKWYPPEPAPAVVRSPSPACCSRPTSSAPYAIASILVTLLFFVGLLSCCVGGLVVLFFTYFYGFYVARQATSRRWTPSPPASTW